MPQRDGPQLAGPGTAPLTVDIVLADPRWAAVPLDSLAPAAARQALAGAGVPEAGQEIALLACDDAEIARLNAGFRGKPAPTNVLSWPAHDLSPPSPGKRPPPPPDDGDPSLGDVAISWDTVAREAAEAGLPVADHATHLIVHAVLHLLGYDHITDADADLMEGIEVSALARLGIDDPYSR